MDPASDRELTSVVSGSPSNPNTVPDGFTVRVDDGSVFHLDPEVTPNVDGPAVTDELFTPPTESGAAFLRCRREAIAVTFLNLQYVVPVKDPKSKSMGSKTVLQSVSGRADPGQLVAVMGSSGSGKTSLLNLLAGRVGEYGGHVFFNGKPLDKRTRRMTAYVQQDDLYYATLTPREHLQAHALLRMDNDVPDTEKLSRVDDVITALGLKKCENAVMGSSMTKKGISGGEARRVTFATELLTDPSVMFVDEPTSGLDAFMAEQVVHTLKDLAQSGRTIICTIHQPSSGVYAMFDRVMFLAEGRVAYFGERSGALPYFAAAGYPCPGLHNPADWFIKVLSILPYDVETSRKRVQRILNSYAESSVSRRNLEEGRSLSIDSPDGMDNRSIIDSSVQDVRSSASWMKQLRVLTWRSFVSMSRDQTLTKIRLIQTVVLGLLLGLIFLQLGDDQKSVQDKNGALYFILTNQAFTGIFGVLQVFPAELMVFKREYQSGMYRTSSYYISRSLSELPFQIVFPIGFCCITYWMIGFRPEAAQFFKFVGIILVSSNSAMSLGLLISTLAPTVQSALALGPLFLLPFMLLGGFFINSNSIPNYLVWIQYISFFKYGFEALLANQWPDQLIRCGPNDTVCRYSTGEQVLTALHPTMKTIGSAIGCLFALLVFFRFISFYFLRRRAEQSIVRSTKKIKVKPAAKEE